jgi:ADP-ribose pyrophosphatase
MTSADKFKPWRTLSKRVALELNKFLKVESHTVELPDGQIIEDWGWIVIPNYINVLPMTTDGDFLLFRQVKYGLEGVSLAPVGGYIESSEDPLLAAKRELIEETGYSAREWVHLGTFRTAPNRGVGMGHLYLALGAIYVDEAHSDDLEEQELVRLSVVQLRKALFAGDIKAMSWTACVSLALHYLENHKTTS